MPTRLPGWNIISVAFLEWDGSIKPCWFINSVQTQEYGSLFVYYLISVTVFAWIYSEFTAACCVQKLRVITAQLVFVLSHTPCNTTHQSTRGVQK